MTVWLILLGVGLIAGVLAGMFGIGGGVVIVPALLYFMKLRPLEAIGTSLAALIPPVGLLGAWEYYRNGYINMRYAAIVAAALFLGAWLGARIMMPLSPQLIRRIYGAFLLLMGARMVWSK